MLHVQLNNAHNFVPSWHITWKFTGEVVEQYPNSNMAMVKSVEQNVYTADKAFELGYPPSHSHPDCNDWQIQTAYPAIGFAISESSSDGDLTPTSRSFINGNWWCQNLSGNLVKDLVVYVSGE